MMQVEELKLKNPGILLSHLPTELLEILRESVKKQTSFTHPLEKKLKSHNRKLAGAIEQAYTLTLSDPLKNFISTFYVEYKNYFNTFDNQDINTIDAWVNVQKKTEYNPAHLHTTHLSWVTWLSIPYTIENEDKEQNSRFANTKSNSRFQFIFSRLDGTIKAHSIDIDKSWEGKIIMFPSYLMHVVYPFYTSDEPRISVAGNIILTDKDN